MKPWGCLEVEDHLCGWIVGVTADADTDFGFIVLGMAWNDGDEVCGSDRVE